MVINSKWAFSRNGKAETTTIREESRAGGPLAPYPGAIAYLFKKKRKKRQE
jgi:hypothetical protein